MKETTRRGSTSKRRPSISTVPAALALTLVAACGSTGSEGSESASDAGCGETEAITVGHVATTGSAGLYVAKEQGFFEEEGLEVELSVQSSGPSVVPSVMNGQLSIGDASTTAVMAAVAGNLPLKIVQAESANASSPQGDTSAILTAPGSGIERPSDLSGKTVAVNALRSSLELVARESVSKDGGDPTTTHFVVLPFPEMIHAVDTGEVDAAVVVEPFRTTGLEAGLEKIDDPYTSAFEAGMPLTVLFTSQEYAASNECALEKFHAAMQKASEHIAQSPDSARAALNEYTEIPAELQAQINLPQYTGELDEDQLAELGDMTVRNGYLETPPDVDNLIWHPKE